MINPFDKTFFRLVLGFTFMLSISFSIMYFVNKYSGIIDGKEAFALKNTQKEIEIRK